MPITPAVAKPPKDPDANLLGYLEQIDARLRRVCESGFVEDPDQLAHELQFDATFLQKSIHGLMADVRARPEMTVDLNDLVDSACRELLTTAGFPLVIKMTANPALPGLRFAREILLAVTLRSLQLCAEHAGAGCHLHVMTLLEDGHAVLRMQTKGSTTTPALPINLRCISLTDLLHTLGCEITVVQAGDTLTLSLMFRISARIT